MFAVDNRYFFHFYSLPKSLNLVLLYNKHLFANLEKGKMESSSRPESRQGKNPKKKKNKIKIIALVLLFILFCAAGYTYYLAKSLENKMAFDAKTNKEIESAVEKPKGSEARNILLVGTDKRSTTKSSRADTIVIVRTGPKLPYTYMVSVPRDSYASIPGRGKSKINHAYAWGGPALLIKAVTELTGLPIHYFSELDFNGFESIVDELGGVDFEVTKGWYDKELKVNVRAGNHRRDGKEALAIVRSRNYPSGDFERIKTQQRFLAATMKESMSSLTDVRKFTSLAGYSRTNLTAVDMLFFSRVYVGSGSKIQMTTLRGKTGRLNGISYVFIDEEYLQDIISLIDAGKEFPEP